MKKNQTEKMENHLNVKYFYLLVLMAGITLSQILTIDLFRGIIELALAYASYSANQRSRSEMIKNVTTIAAFVLAVMGVYDISIAFGWI
jgi:hypothetical protein